MTPAAFKADNLENLIAATTPGGIEAQEKRGQMEQARQQTLPKDLHDHRPAFEALGFEFGEPVDDIFVRVKFPEGWKKQPTDHSMWSDLLDGKGCRRGAIFYKAAFYDRSAHAFLSPRFRVARGYPPASEPLDRVFVEDACGLVQESVEGLPNTAAIPAEDREGFSAALDQCRAAETKLREWLNQNYPEWENPTKCWDDV